MVSNQTLDALAAHQRALLDCIRKYALPGRSLTDLPNRLELALLRAPRHEFVHRYKLRAGSEICFFDPQNPASDRLAEIYENRFLIHLDGDGAELPSTNSEPAYILRLIELLDVRAGDRVLEVGSGSGWLAAIMGVLAGPGGSVVGIEVIESLAAESRVDIARLGIQNVTIISGDGARGSAATAPYDKVIYTAGVAGFPIALVGQMASKGTLIVPLRTAVGGCDVAVMRKIDDHLESLALLPGWFVPMVEATKPGTSIASPLPASQWWPSVKEKKTREAPWPALSGRKYRESSADFLSFLSKVEPDLRILELPEQLRQPHSGRLAFGLVRPNSIALCANSQVSGYGEPDAYEALHRRLDEWFGLGQPTAPKFSLSVRRRNAAYRAPTKGWAVESGDCILHWALRENPGQRSGSLAAANGLQNDRV
jgi:protein-L-isoaspartate(D-aspartate) O-methyltransferase